VDIHLAGADGTELGVLRVTAAEPRNYDIEGITEIHWLDETRFWYVARVGHQGAYVDVWHIGPQFARSELEARVGVAGGPCSLAPDLKLLACVAEDHLANQLGINVFDYRSAISGEPPPEVGTLEHAAYSAIANRSGKADRDARVEGGLHWSGAGQVVFALRQAKRLELGTLDRPQAPTKSWILTLRPVSGIEGRVKTIRESGVGYEIVTEKGAFVVGDEADNTSTRRSAATLAAKKLRPQEPLAPPGMTEFSVLHRWCRDGRHTHD